MKVQVCGGSSAVVRTIRLPMPLVGALKVVGTSGLWEGHRRPASVLVGRRNPHLLIDVAVEIQEWELSP